MFTNKILSKNLNMKNCVQYYTLLYHVNIFKIFFVFLIIIYNNL